MLEWVRSRILAKQDTGAGDVDHGTAAPENFCDEITELRTDRRASRGRRWSDSVVSGDSESSRVLIIAPSEDTRLLYTMLFEEAGHTVYAAVDGPSGLAIAQHRLPDV